MIAMDQGETMNMWITKYALTGGIQEVAGVIKDGYFHPSKSYSSFKVGRDAFATLDEARKDAEARRAKKIGSMEKLIRNLKALQF